MTKQGYTWSLPRSHTFWPFRVSGSKKQIWHIHMSHSWCLPILGLGENPSQMDPSWEKQTQQADLAKDDKFGDFISNKMEMSWFFSSGVPPVLQWRNWDLDHHPAVSTANHLLPVFFNMTGWWLSLPLWKIWVRQLGLFFPIYGKKHAPNHQPEEVLDGGYVDFNRYKRWSSPQLHLQSANSSLNFIVSSMSLSKLVRDLKEKTGLIRMEGYNGYTWLQSSFSETRGFVKSHSY